MGLQREKLTAERGKTWKLKVIATRSSSKVGGWFYRGLFFSRKHTAGLNYITAPGVCLVFYRIFILG